MDIIKNWHLPVSSYLSTLLLKCSTTSLSMEATLNQYTMYPVYVGIGVTWSVSLINLSEFYHIYKLVCTFVIFWGNHFYYGLGFKCSFLIGHLSLQVYLRLYVVFFPDSFFLFPHVISWSASKWIKGFIYYALNKNLEFSVLFRLETFWRNENPRSIFVVCQLNKSPS